jgi:hypothetical protein
MLIYESGEHNNEEGNEQTPFKENAIDINDLSNKWGTSI